VIESVSVKSSRKSSKIKNCEAEAQKSQAQALVVFLMVVGSTIKARVHWNNDPTPKGSF
jgi:hypothetical protein